MNLTEEQYLAHYGILRRSGRYPWGSGQHPEGQYPWSHHSTQAARNRSFLDTINDLHRQGLSDTEICKGFDISTTTLRSAKTIARNQQRTSDQGMAQRLRDKGMSNVAIGQRMGHPESWVRSVLAPGAKDKTDILVSTSNMLKQEVENKKYVMVGAGVENHLGISKERLNTAVAMLKEEGYKVHSLNVRQITGGGKDLKMLVLTKPSTKWSEVQQNQDKIELLNTVRPVSEDYGRTWSSGRIHDPISVNPNRVAVRYAGEGGEKTDGVIYVRHGVEDVSLGTNNYAQVRIKVGDSHYLKGMAMYKDDLPRGVDLVFNTSKERTADKLDAMKLLSSDPDYPFGSVVRQITAGKGDDEHVTSAMNLVNEEGNWKDWTDSIASQVLSKQNPSLAKSQLDRTFSSRQREFDEINALTNPTVKRKLLDLFAGSTDASAVHLKAAALGAKGNQGWHAILPIDSMSPSEVYAPNFDNGTTVALVRYPHAGTFEIPKLTVNNNHPEAKKLLGNAQDAIGIHHETAQRLSGADFDGDAVLVIADNQNKIKTSPSLDGLRDFDPRSLYKNRPPSTEGMSADEVVAYERKAEQRKQAEMGNISNLITDMTIKNASHEEIARAVRHSMVVIDSAKHDLDFKRSAIDNGIRQLKREYQGGANRGASTLLSKANAETWVPETKPRPYPEGGPIDKATGRKMFVPTGRKLRSGADKKVKSHKLAETDDAYTLVSKEATVMERLYADHSNRLKDLANQARLSSIKTPRLQYLPSSKRAYTNEVKTLNSKLDLAERNAPLERKALLIARAVIKQKRDANPNLEGDSLRKLEYQELTIARARIGAGKERIEITPREWEAIQAGAISDSMLTSILRHADLDSVKALATPRREVKMTPGNKARAKDMMERGFTRAQAAQQLGVSVTTLNTSLKEE